MWYDVGPMIRFNFMHITNIHLADYHVLLLYCRWKYKSITALSLVGGEVTV